MPVSNGIAAVDNIHKVSIHNRVIGQEEFRVKALQGILKTTMYQLAVATRSAPRLRRKPRVIACWLGGARRAQILLLLAILLLPTLMPGAVDTFVEFIHPPVQHEHLFGLVRLQGSDPRIPERQEQLKIFIWSLSILAVVLLLWLDIPKGLQRAMHKARQRERMADELLGSQPSRSILLYRGALALASDPDYELQLQSKLLKLDQQLSRVIRPDGNGNLNAANDAGKHQTMILGEMHESAEPAGLPVISNRYLLEKELGRGGMGIVYYAHDGVLDRHVAIKELLMHFAGNDAGRDRFQQEARALARLTHPYIVQIYDFILEKNRACIAMEYVDGQSLDDYLAAHNVLPLVQAIKLGRQLAEAMAYAHVRGVVHRDFKPANVLLQKDFTPKIMDFGLAKITESSVQTQIGTVMGSPAYMSPEQALGEASDARSDIYSLGVTLYRMLTGQLPFSGDAKSIMAAHINREPTSPGQLNAAIPLALDALIMRMLHKDAVQRVQSMNEVISTLASC